MINYSCANCGKELQCKNNNVALVHFLDNNRKNGIDTIRFGDRYRCPKCSANVVIGLSMEQLYGMDIPNQSEYLITLEKQYEVIEIRR